MNFDFDDEEFERDVKIKVVGVGGGGGNRRTEWSDMGIGRFGKQKAADTKQRRR